VVAVESGIRLRQESAGDESGPLVTGNVERDREWLGDHRRINVPRIPENKLIGATMVKCLVGLLSAFPRAA
jgi:hypothetical protein